MKAFRAILFLVATVALWYLGNFALRAVWVAFDLAPATTYTQVINLVLLPVAAVVAWAILRRVGDAERSPEADRREVDGP